MLRTSPLLWSKRIRHGSPHGTAKRSPTGRVYVTTYQQELVAYELGPDSGNLDWHPYIPKLAQTKCLACHQERQIEDLERRHPWRERFINEAAIWTLPLRALKSLAPPGELRRTLVAEGNGTQDYVAVEKQGKLAWSRRGTRASLVELGPNGEPNLEHAIHVRLEPGLVWTAPDGRPNPQVSHRRQFPRLPPRMSVGYSTEQPARAERAFSATCSTSSAFTRMRVNRHPLRPSSVANGQSALRRSYWFYR